MNAEPSVVALYIVSSLEIDRSDLWPRKELNTRQPGGRYLDARGSLITNEKERSYLVMIFGIVDGIMSIKEASKAIGVSYPKSDPLLRIMPT